MSVCVHLRVILPLTSQNTLLLRDGSVICLNIWRLLVIQYTSITPTTKIINYSCILMCCCLPIQFEKLGNLISYYDHHPREITNDFFWFIHVVHKIAGFIWRWKGFRLFSLNSKSLIEKGNRVWIKMRII